MLLGPLRQTGEGCDLGLMWAGPKREPLETLAYRTNVTVFPSWSNRYTRRNARDWQVASSPRPAL
jgi:hypothetical protein